MVLSATASNSSLVTLGPKACDITLSTLFKQVLLGDAVKASSGMDDPTSKERVFGPKAPGLS